VTNKLRGQYRKASKGDKDQILDRVVATTGMGRSTARRMLTGPRLPDPSEQVDGRTLRARVFRDDARARVGVDGHAVRQVPGGHARLLAAAAGRRGDLDKPFATEAASVELEAMTAATVDR
jgi:hypothetical protein